MEDRRLYRAWDAVNSLNQPLDSVSFQDFVNAESIMSAWFNADKMQETGYAYDETRTITEETLAVTCGTLNLERGDRVRHVRIQSNSFGVTALEVQTEKRPYDILGVVDNTDATFKDTTWLRYDLNESMFGLWGFSDAKTGVLNALGLIQ